MLRIPVIVVSAIIVMLLAGCATNSAITLMKASKHPGILMPDHEVVEKQIKGRSISVGGILIAPGAQVESTGKYPAELFRKLIGQQIRKGFLNAGLEKGVMPSLVVDVYIERMRFTKGKILIPDPSILLISAELRSAENRMLMRGGLESRYLSAIPVILPGVVGVVPTAFEGQEFRAFSKIIPAMAVAVTKIMIGLRQGMELSEIEIYPDALSAGSVIVPDLFLRGKPYGLSELTVADIQAATMNE